MSYKDRKQESFGVDKKLFCMNCMIDREVCSAAGDAKDTMNLHCVECTEFIVRLAKDSQNQWNYNSEFMQAVKLIIKDIQEKEK